jgi:DNA-binding response OmpR family regulator
LHRGSDTMNPAKRILILDDDPAHTSLLKFYFEEEGYSVDWAASSLGFVELAAQLKPDLLILDVILPDGDGFVICEHLLKDDRTRNIPVVFVTIREADKERGMAMGAKAYVSKPFKEQELKDAVRKALQN